MIEVSREDGLRVVTLARPERRNALTPESLTALYEAVAAADGGCERGLVILGHGPTFCSGFDLSLCEADLSGGTMRRLLAGLSRVIRAMQGLSVPVVVGVQGAAIAGGCALLGGADAVVADRAARFGYPVVALGVSPAVNAASLHRLILRGPARRLMLDPGLVSAEAAARLGLVHELIDDPANVHQAALARARLLASKPASGMAATRRWLREVEESMEGGGEGAADAGLAVSIGLAGGPEERALLGRAVPGRGPGAVGNPGGGGG